MLLTSNISAITYLGKSECINLTLISNITEQVCAKEIQCDMNKVQVNCPNVSVVLNPQPINFSCPIVQVNSTSVCTPVNDVNFKDGGFEVYNDLKNNSQYVLYTVLIIFVGIILYKNSDKIADHLQKRNYQKVPARQIQQEKPLSSISQPQNLETSFKGLGDLEKI